MGTKDKDLIRVIVTRSEIDLQLIALEFQAKYKKALGEVGFLGGGGEDNSG